MRQAAFSFLTLPFALTLAAACACGCSGGDASAGTGTPTVAWERSFGGSGDEEIYAVAAVADGGAVMAGYSESSDGDLPGARTGEDAWIVKLGPTGDPQWQTLLGGSGDDVAMSVSPTPDGGFAVAGFTWSEDGHFPAPESARPRKPMPPSHSVEIGSPPRGRQGPRRGWVGKLDANGRLLWTRVYGMDGFFGITSIAPMSVGGFIAAGDIVSLDPACRSDRDVKDAPEGAPKPYSFDIWVLRLSPDGDVLWQRCLGGPLNDLPIGAIETPDGGAVVAATAWSRGREPGQPPAPGEGSWAAGFSPRGDTLWRKGYSDSGAERAFSLRAAPGGGFLMAGMRGPVGPGTETSRVNSAVKAGLGGEVDWTATPGGRGRLIDVVPVAGGYLAVLVPYAVDESQGWGREKLHDIVLARLGPDGAEEWRKGFGDAEGRPAAAVAVSADGGLVAVGAIRKPSGPGEKGDMDAWAMKLSP
ncbi:MAG: hypothetical protein LBQ12_04705 [Deltaproteobacteria bacterium]|jgi:hypothetical protein|nr:hypothetical protein [Deltaproteobacteria bacterium]